MYSGKALEMTQSRKSLHVHGCDPQCCQPSRPTYLFVPLRMLGSANISLWMLRYTVKNRTPCGNARRSLNLLPAISNNILRRHLQELLKQCAHAWATSLRHAIYPSNHRLQGVFHLTHRGWLG